MEKKTPLYDCHVESKGKIVPYAGYLLPVQYATGVITEHMAVRTKAGLFDVSHMGEVMLKGKDALANVQMLVTNDCSKMVDGQVKYSPMCYDNGGTVDDVLVYRMDSTSYLIVVNAANRHKDVEWMKTHLFGDVTLEDISDNVALIALQGPNVLDIIASLADLAYIPEKNYTFKKDVMVAGVECLVSRTGYTGEDGFELYCSNTDATTLWNKLLEVGKDLGLIPAGLGCRDTLRLEAGMPLYGHELSEEISPLEAGLKFAVKMDKEDFIGKNALATMEPIKRKRVGLKMIGRGIAREDCVIYKDNQVVGHTTSGTHCPYLNHAVAMGMIELDYMNPGTLVDIEVRGRRLQAEVVSLPFYKRK